MKNSILFLSGVLIVQYSIGQNSPGVLGSTMYQSTEQQTNPKAGPTGDFAGLVDFTGNTSAESLDDLISENNKFGRVVTADNNRSQVLNTVYLFNSNEGITRIYTKNGKGYKVPFANFNLNSKQLEVPLDNNQVFYFDLSNVTFFEKDNHKFIFSNETQSVYEVLLENPKVLLLKKYKTEIMSAMANPLTNQVTKPAHGIKAFDYFMQFGENMVEVQNSRRKFLKSLPSKQMEMEKFIKGNNLNVSDEDSLKEILDFYAKS